MKFRTELKVKPLERPIRYNEPIFAIGSCFTDEVGARLKADLDGKIAGVGLIVNEIEKLSLADTAACRGHVHSRRKKQSSETAGSDRRRKNGTRDGIPRHM